MEEEEFEESEIEEEEKPLKKKKKLSEGVSLTRKPSQYEQLFLLPDGNTANLDEFLVWLGNMVYKISKSVA